MQTSPLETTVMVGALVISPEHDLVGGGPAEDFELRIQHVLENGGRHLVIDLGAVTLLDSRGIRALVRGHATAERLGGSFRLVNAPAQVRSMLQIAQLDRVLGIADSHAEARLAGKTWRRWTGLVIGLVGCFALVWWDMRSGSALNLPDGSVLGPATGDSSLRPLLHPLSAVFRLVLAGLIGILVTAVHKPYVSNGRTAHSMLQAQILLTIAGAMIMIIIGNSLARAFGIAGAASIIRFRTPVEDPKDVTILFLLMGLGMAAGLGAYAIAGLATAFLCIFLLGLDTLARQHARTIRVDVYPDGPEFPTVHVQRVFARHRISFETREITLGEKMRVRYYCSVPSALTLEDLGSELMSPGTGVKSVAWEPVKD